MPSNEKGDLVLASNGHHYWDRREQQLANKMLQLLIVCAGLLGIFRRSSRLNALKSENSNARLPNPLGWSW